MFHLDFMDASRPAGVTSVGIVENVPLDEGTRTNVSARRVQRSGPDAGGPGGMTLAAGDYFKTMGIAWSAAA